MTPDSNNSAGDTQFDSETEERDDAIIGAALRWSLVAGIVLS